MKKEKSYLGLLILLFLAVLATFYVNDLDEEITSEDFQYPLKFSGENATIDWVVEYIEPEPPYWYEGKDVAIDNLGYIYVTGDSVSDLLLVKYDSSGNQIFNRTWHADPYAAGLHVAVDSLNNVYVAGVISIESGMVLIKYNSEGIYQWNRTWIGSGQTRCLALAIDSQDYVYIGGYTEYDAVGEEDACIIKYDSNGNQLWNETWGGQNYEYCGDIEFDSEDNFFIGGHTSSFGVQYTSMYLAKYLNNGTQLWNVLWEINEEHYDYFTGIELDSFGNIMLTGFDPNNGTSVLVKFDPLGNEIWCRSLGYLDPKDIIIDSLDGIYICYASTMGGRNYAYAKYDISGNFQYSKVWETSESDFCFGIAVDTLDSVYLTGYRSFHSYGTMHLVKFKIEPPDPPYFLNIQEDFSIFEGDLSKNITWSPIDDSLQYDSFWIERNETIIMEGQWNGSQIIYSNFSYLSPGYYNFTCFVNNSYGKINGSSVIVSILPNLHSPHIIRNMDNSTLNIGTLDYILSWYSFDNDGNNYSYTIERNSEIVDVGFWKNDTDIEFIETEYLDVGLYNYTCIVCDTSGANNFSSIFITIINHEPTIINNINNFTENAGTTGYLLSWHAIDVDGNNQSYWIERNDVRIVQGYWKNDTDIEFIETDGTLSYGLYNYTCFVNDTSGMVNYSSIFVEINSRPHFFDLIQPLNSIYSPGMEHVFNCTWLDIDGLIQEVKFEFNSQNYTITDNFSGEYICVLSNLAANDAGYDYRWHARDDDGAWNSTGWQVFNLDKQVVDLLILFNGTENNYFNYLNPIINITALNLNSTPGTLQLIVNNELWQEEIGFSLINISQHLNGGHNITVVLMHENYTGYEMKWLNIEEIDPPEIVFEFSLSCINNTMPEYYDVFIRITCFVNDLSPLLWVYLCENSSGTFETRSMQNW
ncbi:MAG: hypothetical protein ACFE8P_15225, partial [Promethearchaeota archaeon]